MSLRVSTVTELRAIPTSAFDPAEAQSVFVAAIGDYFRFTFGTSLTPVTDVVVNSNDNLGQWTRMATSQPTRLIPASLTVTDATLRTMPVSGLPNFSTKAYVNGMGEYFLRPSSSVGYVPDDKTAIKASDGRLWYLSSRPYYPNVPAQNAGQINGREIKEVMIDYKLLTALETSYSATWQGAQYKQIKVKIKNVSGTSTGMTITLPGLTGVYKHLTLYNGTSAPATVSGTGSSTAWTLGMGASDWQFRGEFDLDSGSFRQGSGTTICPNGLGAGVMLSYRAEFQNDDLVNDVTGISIAFTGGYCTGWVEIWGVPFVAPSTTTVVFMGDSITEGGPLGGFRKKVVQEMGMFMPRGPLTTFGVPAPFPRDRMLHAGYGGQTSAYFVANIASLWASYASTYLVYLIGANDAGAGTDPATTAANVATVLDYVHATTALTYIWVGLPLNATSALTGPNAILNAQRPLISAVCATRPWTKAVTLPTLSDAQLDGSYHPIDAAAYDLVADYWLAAMRQA